MTIEYDGRDAKFRRKDSKYLDLQCQMENCSRAPYGVFRAINAQQAGLIVGKRESSGKYSG